MGEVTAVVVIVAVVAIGLLVIVLRWRSATGEQHALRHYQNALDTLRNVSDRMESTRPTITPRSSTDLNQAPPRPRSEDQVTARNSGAAQESRESSRSRAQSASRASDYLPPATAPRAGAASKGGSSRRARAFDDQPDVDSDNDVASAEGGAGESALHDTGPLDHQQPVHPGENMLVFEDDARRVDHAAASPPAPTRASVKALRRSAHPPSRVPSVVAFLLVLVVVAVVAVLLSGVGTHHNASPPKVTSPPTTARAHAKTGTRSVSTTTSTTVPPSVQPIVSTVSIQGASYTAPDTAYTVTLTATGPCWVYADLASTGTVLYTGTLDAGQAQTLSATGPLDVELGHATTMTVTMNGLPVVYPTPYQAVFTMRFIPTTT
jgi:Domain of unknown function (DUF4115)